MVLTSATHSCAGSHKSKSKEFGVIYEGQDLPLYCELLGEPTAASATEKQREKGRDIRGFGGNSNI